MSGSAVTNHDWPKMGKVFSARPTILCLLSFQGYLPIPEAVRLPHCHRRTRQVHFQSPALERSDGIAPRKWRRSGKTQNKKKRGMRDEMRTTVCEILPEWPEEFAENLEDTELLASEHISQDSDSERPTTVVSKSRKHSIYTHFTHYRNCEPSACEPKWQVAPCRRRTGEALPRTEKFGDLITCWSQKSSDEGGESRNNHRHAVVVQNLATQCIQSCPWKTKRSQETEKSSQKFFELSHKPKVTHTDNSLDFGNSCEDLAWNHRTSTPHRSKTNGIAERAVRWVKEGTSAVLLQSRLDERWWSVSMECPRPSGRREDSVWKTTWRTIQRANNSFRSNGWISSDFSERFVKNSSSWQQSITWYLSWLWADRGENFKRRYYDYVFGRFGKEGSIRNSSSKNQRERNIDHTKRWWFHLPGTRWYSKIDRKRLRISRTRSEAGICCKERENLSGESHNDREESWPEE